MGFVNSCRLIFSPDFQNTEELSRGDLQGSCSALIDAVMKYLNFCSSGSKFKSVNYKFTKNHYFFKEFDYNCRTTILKNAS